MSKQYFARILSAGVLAVLASCGQSGPSKQDIASAIQRAGEEQLAQMNGAMSQMTGQASHYGNVVKVTVTDATCTPHENGVFHCNATVTGAGNTVTHDIDIKQVQGKWTIVG